MNLSQQSPNKEAAMKREKLAGSYALSQDRPIGLVAGHQPVQCWPGFLAS